MYSLGGRFIGRSWEEFFMSLYNKYWVPLIIEMRVDYSRLCSSVKGQLSSDPDFYIRVVTSFLYVILT